MKRQDLIKSASAKCNEKHGSDWLSIGNEALQAYLNGETGCPACEKKDGEGMENKSDLASVIAQAISGKVKAGIDEAQVEKLIDGRMDKVLEAVSNRVKELVGNMPARKLEVITSDGSRTIIEGRTHKAFEQAVTLAALRLNLYLVGPAGSGKTTIAEQIAQALQVPYYCMSVGLQTSKADFLGYIDAHGKTVRTLWREAYEKGGVFLVDEIDSGNSNVLTVINAATANNVCAFPDGMIQKHKDFICLAAANTYGKGQDRVYVGRNQLDGATLNRFVPVDVSYDEDLEKAAALAIYPEAGHYVETVQNFRRQVERHKLRIIISPRASIYGARMLAAGFDEKTAAELTMFAGLTAEDKARLGA